MTDATTNTESQHGRVHDAYETARDTASQAYTKTKDAAGHAVEVSKETAQDAARRTASAIEGNPLGILVGGLAVGAIAGALLPRSAREKELLAPIGRKLGETIRAATQAAREAGRSELEAVGLTKDAARDQAKTVFDGFTKALSSAGSAAAKAGKKVESSNG